jgi:two-component system, OmpR family, sensor histidine kinase MtrB
MSADRPRTPAGLAFAVATRRFAVAPVRLWRRSLRVRTVLITLLLSSVALVGVGTVVSYTIGQGLFEDRLQQVLAESARATTEAQSITAAATSNDSTTLDIARTTAIDDIRTAARPDGLVWRTSTGGGVQLPAAVSPAGVDTLVSAELARALDADAVQQWQSVAIPMPNGAAHPAIVVGDAIRFGDGESVLYLIYDIEDVQDTLTVVQRALLVGGAALLLLIGAVTYVVTGVVTAPLRQAAITSEQLAAGHLDRRIPERGADVVTTLARSFNRMAESLQRQITQLANLSRVQQRFVSDVSHELRTPLTTIRLASDVIYDARADAGAPVARSAELLKTQVERFEALLADLLEISRMDAHATELTGEPTNLVDLTRETIDALGGLTAESGSTIELVAPGGHVDVEVDARRIARIVRNLLANAIEHGEGRPVVVTIDSSAHAIGLGVRDHGIGLSGADAARVFDRFWRADPSRQRRIGGTGLGLAISLEDAQLHGGTLEVWSREGDGTNFVLTLPRASEVGDLGHPVPLVPSDALPDRETRPRRGRKKRPVEVGS